MRRLFCIAASFVILAAGSAAGAVWSLEIVGGLNMSKLAGNDTDARVIFADDQLGAGEISGDIGGTRFGLATGAMVDVFFTENIGVRSGFLWARKGGDGSVRVQGDIPGLGLVDLTADVTMTLDYFEWPVLAVVAFPISNGSTVRMMAGPVFAFKTNADLEISLAGFSDSQDIGDQVKGTDVLGLLGVGVAIPVGVVEIVVDGSYSRGFTKIDDTSTNLDIKNSEFRITGGVAIPLGPR